MMNAAEYKKYHEAFMQNNHGSTSFHTLCCIFFTVQCAIYISIRPRYSSFRQYIYEYIIMVLPMILIHTILAEYIFLANAILFSILSYGIYRNKSAFKNLHEKNVFPNDRVPLVSSLRGLTYLITVFAILAVDFRDFPRYLAKTERFGYSLMDTGVGLFVTMSGIVHKDLRNHSFKNIVKGNLKVVTILLVLGIGRFVSVKQLDYQEHITEYGVHWNFFFTIAVCKVVATILLYFFDNAFYMSFITLIFHESLLYFGLQDWVFGDSPRDTLISANREGISSCLGFVSIYLFAAHLREHLMYKKVTKHDTVMKLVHFTLFIWILTSWDFVQPTSRTLANASYCIYMDAILLTITTVMYYVNVLYNHKSSIQVPLILSIINTNGLSYFLVANLCTGAVNLSMRTLFVSSSTAFLILNVYMIVTLAIVAYLKKLGVRI